MKPEWYYLGTFCLAVISAAGGLVWKTMKFFIGMDNKVESVGKDVSTIMTNHLPHIYQSLGNVEGQLGIRKDSIGDPGRN